MDDDYNNINNEGTFQQQIQPLVLKQLNEMDSRKISGSSLETLNGDEKDKDIFYGKLFKAVPSTKL